MPSANCETARGAGGLATTAVPAAIAQRPGRYVQPVPLGAPSGPLACTTHRRESGSAAQSGAARSGAESVMPLRALVSFGRFVARFCPELPINPELPIRGFTDQLDCFMLCGPRKIESIGLPWCRCRPIDAIPGGSAHCSWCWQRQSAWLCSQAESQRPPSRSSSRLFHPGFVTHRAASAASPGTALHWRDPACVRAPTTGQYDQAVVANTVALLAISWVCSQWLRMSNACASGEFFYQRISQELQQVGEARPNKVFMAESRSCPRRRCQPGLFLSVSPDSGQGSRMSWVGLEDTATVYGQRNVHRRRWQVRRVPWPTAYPQRAAQDQALDQGQPGH